MATSLQTHHANESAHEAATPQAHDGIESTGLQPCDTHFAPFLSEESDTHAYHSEPLASSLAGRDESTETNGELFPVMIDDVRYHDKETAKGEVPRITNRLKPKTFVWLTIDQLKQCVRSGMTFTCGAFYPAHKTFGDSFACMRLWALDFDNKAKDGTPLEECDFGYITMRRALARCVKHDLKPVLMYTTLSCPEGTTHRFRIVVDLGEYIEDEATAAAAARAVLALFPEADSSCSNLNRLSFGGRRTFCIKEWEGAK